jgi:hypothetical protein
LCVLFTFPGIRVDDLVKTGNPIIYLLPQFWFLGIYQVLIGHHTLVYFKLSKMGFAAVAVSTLLSIISYTISYRASMQKGFQSAGIASYSVSIPGKIWNRLLHKIFLRRSPERASYHFAAQTVFRRQEHMLYLGSFVAVAIALICLGFFLIKTGYGLPPSQHLNVLLSFPLIFSFFMLVGLRFAFSIPADLNANWVFKMIGKNQQDAAFGGAYKFLLCAFYIPLLLIFVPFYLTIWEPRLVALHFIYVSMLSLILIELLLLNFKKLPFTCSYLPGNSNIKLFWPAYVLGCTLYSYGTTVLERWILRDLKCFLAFLLIAGILLIQVKRYRSRQIRVLDEIQFEETPPDQRTILTIET